MVKNVYKNWNDSVFPAGTTWLEWAYIVSVGHGPFTKRLIQPSTAPIHPLGYGIPIPRALPGLELDSKWEPTLPTLI